MAGIGVGARDEARSGDDDSEASGEEVSGDEEIGQEMGTQEMGGKWGPGNGDRPRFLLRLKMDNENCGLSPNSSAG